MNETDHALFRHVVGKLRYVLPERFDLAFPMWLLSKKLSSPTYEDLARLKRLCRYVLGTTKLRLVLNKNEQQKQYLEVFVDSDFGGDKESRRSVSS